MVFNVDSPVSNAGLVVVAHAGEVVTQAAPTGYGSWCSG
ncbi:hypothetical protein Ae168Ps1_6042c [Pseudonocardia sp. Ae168_Ps1]|nr:hypothetical protein Ae150APs1_5986c [Pseudonocardia sp. Ae150A_Ps1]OLL70577.1 hypothetical protein Ae168Ps1_6042c [Pseudonocardia sp. Ae168_Ps1]OLL70800.1 hypothetical protein Ae263Ps1_6214c [Pseudonocardia sp. Ae263_Ps1]OLL89361.1 hypothetical protein Ae356Ps1_6105c [Pseudonocardia sp. Ae356_Ps1]OLL89815.1 hypothetical protein Ae331Ps2_6151 [Pseudonocardia sp. Ae331_Ps2]OLM09758.1 hypothetical protein Ae706Ps2_6220 [Pseudonocardia sp. Ae706_Ps2]